jgi:hypothetical protein
VIVPKCVRASFDVFLRHGVWQWSSHWSHTLCVLIVLQTLHGASTTTTCTLSTKCSEMNTSMQFGEAFDLPLDEMGAVVGINDHDADSYNADGSFALGEIMQHASATHFADVAEPLPVQSLAHELEAAAAATAAAEPVEQRSFLESLYDSLRNSFQRQHDNDASMGHDPLQTSVSESGHWSGQVSMQAPPQAAAKVVTPRVAAMLHGKTKLYVSKCLALFDHS